MSPGLVYEEENYKHSFCAFNNRLMANGTCTFYQQTIWINDTRWEHASTSRPVNCTQDTLLFGRHKMQLSQVNCTFYIPARCGIAFQRQKTDVLYAQPSDNWQLTGITKCSSAETEKTTKEQPTQKRFKGHHCSNEEMIKSRIKTD